MDVENECLPASREEAVLAGEVFYFTGEPCRHGHIAKRYTTAGSCYQCAQERYAESRQAYTIARLRKAKAQLAEMEAAIVDSKLEAGRERCEPTHNS